MLEVRKMENGETSRDLQSRPWQSYNTVYTNAKAGMEGVDKEKVQRIVYEMSKGSKYFQNEERKEALIKQKIEHMRDRSAKLTSADISYYQKVVDKRILELEAARDLSRIWLHVDMDAFYAAVETLSNPSLKGKPMAVGSLSMLSTANYEARKFGVRAAMPGFIARKLCPDLIIVPTDFTKYNHYSDLTRKVFRNYDPNFIAGSLDEAYLDITEVCRERGPSGGISIAEELRSSVFAATGLTCSAGVAPNRLLAKVCSDINKPNGQFVLPNDRVAVMTFISSLPIRKIGGIGKVTEHVLKDALGIKTCEEMVQKGSLIYALFSRSTADFFLCVGLGLGKTDTPETRSRKSISNERTFAATGNETLLYRKLVEIAEMLSDEMKKEGLSAKTLTLKLKTASFEIRTRAVSLQKYICSSEDILKHASILLKAELPISIRLIGLRMSQFNGENSDPSQKSITSFINPTASSKPNLDDHNLMDLNSSSTCLNLSFDIHDTSNEQSKVPVESEETRVLSDNCCTSAKDADELYPIQEDIRNDESDMGHTVSNVCVVPISREGERLKVLEVDALLEKHGECEPGTMDGQYLALQTEAASTSRSIEPIFWIDGYKCSLCGSELPPNFIEERQEHIDFHLAEKLQEEESVLSSSSTLMTKRRVMKEAKRSKVKKQKQATRDNNHIPIHAFFAKSCQNF